MTPTTVNEQIPMPPPAYHREQARLGLALHIDAFSSEKHRQAFSSIHESACHSRH
jgi:hypothetical protein